jgi:phosphoribosylformylglycinamidine synthase
MPPEVNLLNEKNNGECLLKLIDKNLILSSHDISSGGLITALSEMSLNLSMVQKYISQRNSQTCSNIFFGEDQARYVIEIDKKNYPHVEKILKENNIFFENIGITQKNTLRLMES